MTCCDCGQGVVLRREGRNCHLCGVFLCVGCSLFDATVSVVPEPCFLCRACYAKTHQKEEDVPVSGEDKPGVDEMVFRLVSHAFARWLKVESRSEVVALPISPQEAVALSVPGDVYLKINDMIRARLKPNESFCVLPKDTVDAVLLEASKPSGVPIGAMRDAVFTRYRSLGWYIPTVEGGYAFHAIG